MMKCLKWCANNHQPTSVPEVVNVNESSGMMSPHESVAVMLELI